MRVNLSYFIFLLFFLIVKSLAAATGESGRKFYEGWDKKSQNKAVKRWTIEDWLDTKKKINMMDQWLAAHSSANPYEFYLGGDTISHDYVEETVLTAVENTETRRLNRANFGAFASIVGLEAQYESDDKDELAWLGIFNLRVFGIAQQSTHITLGYGLQNSKIPSDKESTQNQFASVTFSLYLLKHFGFDGLYRYYLAAKIPNSEYELAGERFEVRAFIDYSFLQIYGLWFKQPMRKTADENPVFRITRSGLGFGLRLYF